jgi:hypothetical protein
MAMKRLKVSELEAIQERPTLVMYIPQDGFKPNILHIVKRQGFQQTNGITKDKSSVNVTQCNRPLEHTSVYSKSILPDDKLFWKLCPNCGRPEDFQASLNEYHVWFAEHRRKTAEEETRKQEEAARAWERYLQDLRHVANVINTTNTFQAEVDEKNGRVIVKKTEYPEEWLEVTQYLER